MFLSHKTSQDNCKSNHPPPPPPSPPPPEDATDNAKVKYFLSMETKLIIRCSCYSRYTWVPPLPSPAPLPGPSNLLILIIFHYHQHNHQSVVCSRKIIRHFLFQQIHVLHPNNNHFFTENIFAAWAYFYIFCSDPIADGAKSNFCWQLCAILIREMSLDWLLKFKWFSPLSTLPGLARSNNPVVDWLTDWQFQVPRVHL